MWVAKIQEEEQQKALSEKLETIQQQVSLLFLTCSITCSDPDGGLWILVPPPTPCILATKREVRKKCVFFNQF